MLFLQSIKHSLSFELCSMAQSLVLYHPQIVFKLNTLTLLVSSVKHKHYLPQYSDARAMKLVWVLSGYVTSRIACKATSNLRNSSPVKLSKSFLHLLLMPCNDPALLHSSAEVLHAWQDHTDAPTRAGCVPWVLFGMWVVGWGLPLLLEKSAPTLAGDFNFLVLIVTS